MAVVIPIAMAYFGTSAAIATAVGLTAAVGATVGAAVVSAGIGYAVSKSGIGAKIDKAASKVFGEDLVKAGNIAGSIYLAMGAPGMGTEAAAGAEASLGDSGGLPSTTDITGLENASSAAAGSVSPDPSGIFGGEMAPQSPLQVTGNLGSDVLKPMSVSEIGKSVSQLPAGTPSLTSMGLQAPPATSPGILSQLGDKLSNLSGMEKAQLINTGGQMIAGAAQGRERAKELQQARDDRDLRTSGSGLYDNYTYRPRNYGYQGGVLSVAATKKG